MAFGAGIYPPGDLTVTTLTVTGAAIFSSTVSVTGDLTLAATAGVVWTGRASLYASGVGTLAVRNSANSADAALTCAGITASGAYTRSTHTVQTSQPMLDLAQTWDTVGTTYIGAKIVYTDTASASGSLALQILGGAAGATTLMTVNKAGDVTCGDDFIVPSSGSFLFTSRGGMDSSADGVFLLRNLAGTDCTALDLAGASAELRINGTKVVDSQQVGFAALGAFTGGVVGFLDAAERDGIRTQLLAIRTILNAHGLTTVV